MNAIICAGSFNGGEIEPGTFHDDEDENTGSNENSSETDGSPEEAE